MKSTLQKTFLFASLLLLVSGCARDLSNSVYTSDATLSLTLEGEIISIRNVTIKGSDQVGGNANGMIAGGVLGAGLGATTGNTALFAGVAVLGVGAGALIQSTLDISEGSEYIIKVDTSKIKDGYYEGNAAMRNVMATARTSGLITVVQSTDKALNQGQHVYVIYSDKRTRVIPAYASKK